MADIFLSYKREDQDAARGIAGDLEAEGFAVFFDVRVEIGDAWDVAIERELEAASAVVALWSPASRDSDWVRREAREARRRGVLFPAFIKECRPPLEFSDVQTADLSARAPGDRAHPQWRLLIETLRRQAPMNKPAPAPVAVAPSASAIGLLLPEGGSPWHERIAAGGGTYRTARFGVSLMDLELKQPAATAALIAPSDVAAIERAARTTTDDFAAVLLSLAAHFGVGDYAPPDREDGDVSLASDTLLKDAAERAYPPALELVCALGDKYLQRHNPKGRAGLFSLETCKRYEQRGVDQAWAPSQYRRCISILADRWDTGDPGDWDRRKPRLEEALNLALAAAQRGLTRAECIAASFFEGSWGGIRNDAQLAVYWYDRAAEKGDALALSSLGRLYIYGKGVRQNQKQGVAYLERAVAAGELGATLLLAKALENGWGASRDKKRAIALYKEVAMSKDAAVLLYGEEARDALTRLRETW